MASHYDQIDTGWLKSCKMSLNRNRGLFVALLTTITQIQFCADSERAHLSYLILFEPTCLLLKLIYLAS